MKRFLFWGWIGLVCGQSMGEIPFRFSDLERLVRQNQVQSIEQLLPLLPRELRTRYVLMKKSRSLQGATPENPRVIMFTQKANFLVTFNGDPNERGFNLLESIEYKPEQAVHEFRSIRFEPTGPVISAPNPKKCKTCHTPALRPNWEPYPFWPGAVGEEDTLSEEDLAHFRRFITDGASHPRYRHLFREENLKYTTEQNFVITPAFRLNTHLYWQKSERFVSMIRRSPDYEKFKYAIQAALTDCENITNFVPAHAVGGGWGLWQSLNDEVNKKYNGLPAQHLFIVKDIEKRIATNLRYLIETRQISLRAFSFSLGKRYFYGSVSQVDYGEPANWLRYSDSSLGGPSFHFTSFLRHFDREKPITGSLYTPTDAQNMRNYCDNLRQRSRSAFGLE